MPNIPSEIFGNVDIKKAEKIFKDIQYKKVHQTDVFVSDKLEKIVLKNCGFINPEDIEDAISAIFEKKGEEIIKLNIKALRAGAEISRNILNK